MDASTTALEREKAFAVNVAAGRYPIFAAYASEHRLFERFTRDQVAQLRVAYEHWHAVIATPAAMIPT